MHFAILFSPLFKFSDVLTLIVGLSAACDMITVYWSSGGSIDTSSFV